MSVFARDGSDGRGRRCAVVGLLACAVVLAGCSPPWSRPPRKELPVAVLLSAVPAAPTPAAADPDAAEYSRVGQVQWSPAAVFGNPFGVRHRADVLPATSFDLIFDARLYTSPDALSYVGHAAGDPGSVAVLTHHQGLFKLTVDSPLRGHYSVQPQPDGSYAVREHHGLGASHGADDFDDLKTHLLYATEVVRGMALEAARLDAELSASRQALQTAEDELATASGAGQQAALAVKHIDETLVRTDAEISNSQAASGHPAPTTSPELASLAAQITALTDTLAKYEQQSMGIEKSIPALAAEQSQAQIKLAQIQKDAGRVDMPVMAQSDALDALIKEQTAKANEVAGATQAANQAALACRGGSNADLERARRDLRNRIQEVERSLGLIQRSCAQPPPRPKPSSPGQIPGISAPPRNAPGGGLAAAPAPAPPPSGCPALARAQTELRDLTGRLRMLDQRESDEIALCERRNNETRVRLERARAAFNDVTERTRIERARIERNRLDSQQRALTGRQAAVDSARRVHEEKQRQVQVATKELANLGQLVRDGQATLAVLRKNEADAQRRLVRQNLEQAALRQQRLTAATQEKTAALARRALQLKALDAAAGKAAEARQRRAQSAQQAVQAEERVRELGARQGNHLRVQQWLQSEVDQIERELPRSRAPAPRADAALPRPPGISTTMTRVLGIANAHAQAATGANPPLEIAVRSWKIDPGCADAAGRIDLAVVVSRRVMNGAIAKHRNKDAAVKHLNIEIRHALDITNAALRGSSISTPGIDIGFALVNPEPLVIDIPDPTSSYGVQEVYGGILPSDKAAKKSQAFYSRIEKDARDADVVLMIVEGDQKLRTLRGLALGTPNPHGDLTKNQRVAVVKRIASEAEHIYTFAHELGHTLGAGHFETQQATYSNFQPFAKGAVLAGEKKRWASLMAVSDCQGEKEKNFNCRRVPFFSNPALRYPDYGDKPLGAPDQDNAGAMRLIRDNVTRLRCARPAASPAVWMQSGLALPETPEVPPPTTTAWEAQSIWVLPAADPDGRATYRHSPPPAGSGAFVNVMLHNAQKSEAAGQLEIWRAKAAAGLLLSPRWPEDMERLDRGSCAAPREGTLVLPRDFTTIVQVPCRSGIGEAADVPAAARDSWVVRWAATDTPAAASPTVATRDRSLVVADYLAAQPFAAWRSMRDVDLALNDKVEQTVLVRNLLAAEPRQVNVRIESAPNQFNFTVRDSGLSEIHFPKAVCRDAKNPQCASGLFSRGEALAYFDGSSTTIELTLPPGTVAPIVLHFERTALVPQQNVLLRVVEHDVALRRDVGGTSYVVRHAPRAAEAAALR